MGEFQQAIGPHRSPADFHENETLSASNLASTLRWEHEERAGSCFDPGCFQRDVIKSGARVVKHVRRLLVQLACAMRPFWEEWATCGVIPRAVDHSLR